jgi:hypothetical protein
VHFLISVFVPSVKHGGGYPRSQYEVLVDPWGVAGTGALRFISLAPFGLPSAAATDCTGGSVALPALSLRIDGPSSSRR